VTDEERFLAIVAADQAGAPDARSMSTTTGRPRRPPEPAAGAAARREAWVARCSPQWPEITVLPWDDRAEC
jgi:hypothetical protein